MSCGLNGSFAEGLAAFVTGLAASPTGLAQRLCARAAAAGASSTQIFRGTLARRAAL
jgi:hypothetical protein